SLVWASSAARAAAYFATSLLRVASRFSSAKFGITASILERELERREQRLRFLVGFRGRRDADVHPAQSIDLVVLDFGEDDLLLDAHVVVTTTVKALPGNTAEVTDTGNRDRDQTIEELIHARTAQRDHAADRITVTDLETRDRLASPGHDRLLA